MSTPSELTPSPESAFRQQLIRLIDDALTGNPKAALIAARVLPGEIDWLQRKAVMHARANGYDWGKIGRLLAMTRQGTRQKFGRPRPITASPYTIARQRYLRPYREADEMAARFAAGLPIIQRLPEPDDPIFW